METVSVSDKMWNHIGDERREWHTGEIENWQRKIPKADKLLDLIRQRNYQVQAVVLLFTRKTWKTLKIMCFCFLCFIICLLLLLSPLFPVSHNLFNYYIGKHNQMKKTFNVNLFTHLYFLFPQMRLFFL